MVRCGPLARCAGLASPGPGGCGAAGGEAGAWLCLWGRREAQTPWRSLGHSPQVRCGVYFSPAALATEALAGVPGGMYEKGQSSAVNRSKHTRKVGNHLHTKLVGRLEDNSIKIIHIHNKQLKKVKSLSSV